MAIKEIFEALSKSLAQLPDPDLGLIVVKSIGLAIGLFFMLALGISFFVGSVVNEGFSIPFIGEVASIGQWLGFGSFLLLFGLSSFLMIPLAVFISSFFLANVSQAVERKHYPEVPPGIETSLSESLKDSINFLGLAIAVNIFALILYLFFFVFSPLIFWAVNGYLLGREFFQMAAARHIGRDAVKALRTQYFGRIWFAGILLASPLSLPLVNLLVPILGAAMFTHLFHQLWQAPSD